VPFGRRWLFMENVVRFLFVFSICTFCFLLGIAVGVYRLPPFRVLQDAKQAAESMMEKYSFLFAKHFEEKMHDKYPNLWFAASEPGSGVIEKQQESADLILYSDCSSDASLIDRSGNVIRRWRLPFYEAYPKAAHILDPVPEDQIYWSKARVGPKDSLIAMYAGINQSPYGGGIVKVDQDSAIIWAAAINAHHDFKLNGNSLFVLTHAYEGGRIEDYLTVLDASTGDVRRSISLREAIMNSPYASLLPREPKGDYLHTNSIEVVDREWATRCNVGNEGDIVLSHNNLSAVTLLDMKTEEVKWALLGVSEGAHDPDLLESCRIAFFDNNGGRSNGAAHSRLLAYDFKEHRIELLYSDPGNFHSVNRGSQQRLKNGHWLITESTQGTIFEIDNNGTVVWKFITPRRTETSVCVVNYAHAYLRANLPFLNAKAR